MTACWETQAEDVNLALRDLAETVTDGVLQLLDADGVQSGDITLQARPKQLHWIEVWAPRWPWTQRVNAVAIEKLGDDCAGVRRRVVLLEYRVWRGRGCKNAWGHQTP